MRRGLVELMETGQAIPLARQSIVGPVQVTLFLIGICVRIQTILRAQVQLSRKRVRPPVLQVTMLKDHLPHGPALRLVNGLVVRSATSRFVVKNFPAQHLKKEALLKILLIVLLDTNSVIVVLPHVLLATLVKVFGGVVPMVNGGVVLAVSRCIAAHLSPRGLTRMPMPIALVELETQLVIPV
jgi:hypothetical protein